MKELRGTQQSQQTQQPSKRIYPKKKYKRIEHGEQAIQLIEEI